MTTPGDDEEPRLDDLSDLVSGVLFPVPGDKLFKSGSWVDSAQLNHRLYGDKWSVYATGYRDAADMLVDRAAGTGRHLDFLVYPIVFLYRQHIELMIKNLIRSLWLLLEKNPPNKQAGLVGHRLGAFWAILRPLLEEYAPGQSTAALEQTGSLIDELCAVDPESMGFRYPHGIPDKTGARLPTLSELTEVDLRNLKEVMGRIAALLGACEMSIDADLQRKAETHPEYRSLNGPNGDAYGP